jgi:hypothetical protein
MGHDISPVARTQALPPRSLVGGFSKPRTSTPKMEAADLPKHLVTIYNTVAFFCRVKTPLPEHRSDGFSPNIFNNVKRLLLLYSGHMHSTCTLKMVTFGLLESLVTTYKSIRCHNLGNYQWTVPTRKCSEVGIYTIVG